MPILKNHTFAEIEIGQTATWSKRVEEKDIVLFAIASGDANPVHLDPAYAATTPFGEQIAHGMLTGAFFSAALATELPGPGTVYLGQTLRFRLPVKIGDMITVQLEVTDKRDKRRFVTLECKAFNQHNKLVASGSADVMAPEEKISIEAPTLPRATLER